MLDCTATSTATDPTESLASYGTVAKKLIVYTYYIYTITMGLFDFFDYTPKSFFKKVEENLIPMDPKEILNMKATKVNEKFDEK